ncbi:hypothetical protein ABH924_003342 [Arthrobacter sp. GAS37]|uniref:2OG-Fe dioxygenase family protein n=1 Tax=Arthrobacter sp. GAS37 TaxID=3156261 RepID=UPI0038350052
MNDHVKITTPALDLYELQESFENIPLDKHFEGGYRHRTQSRFSFQDGTIVRLENVELFQSSDINPLENYGGIRRDYNDLPEGIEDNASFKALIQHWAAGIDAPAFNFSAHQIRTLGAGQPVPEGRHRDGYEYVGVFVVDRHDITDESALTSVWEIGTDKKIVDNVVLRPGELVSFDDRRVIHDASPLIPINESTARRDVIILTYPDHREILEHGEVPEIRN